MFLQYLTVAYVVTSYFSQCVIDKVVDQWRTRLRACVKAKALRFEHLLYTSAVAVEN